MNKSNIQKKFADQDELTFNLTILAKVNLRQDKILLQHVQNIYAV